MRPAIEAAQANGLLPTEGVGGETVDAMKDNPLAPAALGLADFGVNTYNFLMPGEQFDVKRQTEGMLAPYDNTKQTIRDVASFVIPEILGLRGAGLRMQGTKLPGMLGKLSKLKSFNTYLSLLVGGGAMGMGIQDINLDPYGDLEENQKEGMNATGA